MEPCLMVIGVNHRTAPVAVRERFWMPESRRRDALAHLSRAEAIDEIVVVATCNRTEFILWTSDASAGANSVLSFLTHQYGLRLCEWKHFYRLLDDAALAHIFRVASSLDSMVLGEPEVVEQVKAACALAQEAGASGPFLDAVFQKALAVSARVRCETAIANCALSVPYAAVELARHIFGSLQGRKVLLLGAGKMSQLSACYLAKSDATDVRVCSRILEKAQELARTLGGTAIPLEQRRQHLLEADVVISSTSCPHLVLTREELEAICRERGGAPLLLVDIAVPRDIDPAVREVHGVFLYDIDELEQVVKRTAGERQLAAADGEKIVIAETRFFRHRLLAERVVPTIVALRERLNDLARQELEALRQENGPFPEDQDTMMESLTARITQRIAGALARELKELPEKVQQEQMTAAVQRLFHLEQQETAVAGVKH